MAVTAETSSDGLAQAGELQFIGDTGGEEPVPLTSNLLVTMAGPTPAVWSGGDVMTPDALVVLGGTGDGDVNRYSEARKLGPMPFGGIDVLSGGPGVVRFSPNRTVTIDGAPASLRGRPPIHRDGIGPDGPGGKAWAAWRSELTTQLDFQPTVEYVDVWGWNPGDIGVIGTEDPDDLGGLCADRFFSPWSGRKGHILRAVIYRAVRDP